jgi:hypothetical protein
MSCGCGPKNGLLIHGGKQSRRVKQSKRSKSSNKRKSSRRVKSSNKRKQRIHKQGGGVNASLLGDPSSSVLNYTSKLLGTPGAPSLPWTQPANQSYGYGNSYFV